MSENIESGLISFDQMKSIIDKEVSVYVNASTESVVTPAYAFEQGKTRVFFPLPFLNEALLEKFTCSIKNHLANVRIHHFENGYYAFQALNSNLFKTDNILDNIKIEFTGIIANFKAEISKKGNLNQEEINLVIELFRIAISSFKENPAVRLARLGASLVPDNNEIDWSYIAGYEEVKRNIKESIILPMKNPDVYDAIAKFTRSKFETNRPRAVLFEGAPGVGKTTAARVIANEASVPLIYVPIESIMSKWYGQSSQNLSQIFDACEDLGGAILFLDEIDSLAGSRDQNMFEATRRVLSVLLRRLDGIDAIQNTITIGATNRKNDLDNALISRFDQSIHFPLPNEKERAAIFANYARHLAQEDYAALAVKAENLSGRNIKDICEFAERRWARKIIVKNLEASAPPPEYYKHALRLWKESN